MEKNRKLNDVSFEVALAELENIVSQLERGDVPLEKSISLYEQGIALRKHCDKLLTLAEARIEKISASKDGLVTEAFTEGGIPSGKDLA